MPYKNPYNEMIAEKIHTINKNHINNEVRFDNNPVRHDIVSPLEHIVDRNSNNYIGGDGHKANLEAEAHLATKALLHKTLDGGSSCGIGKDATVRDEGLEHIKPSIGGAKNQEKRKLIQELGFQVLVIVEQVLVVQVLVELEKNLKR